MNGEQNFKEVTIEQFYEVCTSFQDDPYEVNKEKIDIGQELTNIKKLKVGKGKVVANFVNCLQTMYKEEVAKETDNRVISKKCIKIQNSYKEDQEDYDEVDGLMDELKKAKNWMISIIKDAVGNKQYRKIGKQLFRIIVNAISDSLEGEADIKQVIFRLINVISSSFM